MHNILIFASSPGKAAERLVYLFNEGNRIHTDLVFSDITDSAFGENFDKAGVRKIFFDDTVWHEQQNSITEEIKNAAPNLIVIDSWTSSLPVDVAKSLGIPYLQVTSPEKAPIEVVKALESLEVVDDPQEVEEIEVEDDNPEEETPTKSIDEEWAESLQMNFESPKSSPLPPPLPPGPDNPSPQNISPDNLNQGNTNPEGRQPFTEYPSQGSYQQGMPSYHPQYERPPYFRHDYDRRGEQPPMPPTYLIWSILSAIFCCFIPGIVAIIFSSQVSSRYYAGDIEGARRSSRIAEIWIIVSFVLGVLSATLWIPFLLVS